jgi:hypothetical protein
MAKRQLAGMERQPTFTAAARAISPIADNRMAQGCQVDTDLVLPAGFESELQERFIASGAKYSIVSDCQLATSVDPMDEE